MRKKKVTTRARRAIAHMARRGVKGLSTVAADAFGAAAQAATQVVLRSAADTLREGAERTSRAGPQAKRWAARTAMQAVKKPAEATLRRKRRPAKTGRSRPKTAHARRHTGKKRKKA